jgi:colanic acid biosynthesis glycosyl transferase WcaI
MTHVLFVTPYYPPEKTPPAIRISEMAKCLLKRGYQVTVLTTFPNFPSGVVSPEYRGHVIKREVQDGIHVVRVWSYITPNKGFLRRILAQLSFGCIAPFLGWKHVGRPDVIIVESPPLFNAIGGRLLAWGKRCPFIFTVADLWPDAAIQLGVLRNSLLIRLSRWLERSTYQKASFVWAVTNGIRKKLVERGLSPERVFLLTNGVDTTRFRPIEQAQARAELGWDDRFTILYAGTHGLVYGLEILLDVAERLGDRSDMHIIFAGDGVTKADLMEKAHERQLHNVTFLDAQPHERMPLLLNAADVCPIPIRNVPIANITLPAKMFEIMACARPILLGLGGEARKLAVQEAHAALYVEPENVDALLSAILYLREHPEVATALGQHGRAFVTEHFDRDHLVSILEERIATLLPEHDSVKTIAPVSVEAKAQGD